MNRSEKETTRQLPRHVEERIKQLKRMINPKTGNFYSNMTYTLYGVSSDENGVIRDNGTGRPVEQYHVRNLR